MAGKAGGSENCTLRSRKQPNCSSVTARNTLIGVGLMECRKKPEYEQLSKKTMIRTLLVLQLALYKSPIGYSTDLFFQRKHANHEVSGNIFRLSSLRSHGDI